MEIITRSIVTQEVPGEISIALAVWGCPMNCKGCSWSEQNKATDHYTLEEEDFRKQLDVNEGFVTCITFLGGEWCEDLVKYLGMAQEYGYKTCLYTGRDDVSEEVKSKLNYLKVGKYVESLGGLDSPTTNQKFINLDTGEVQNYLFLK